VLYTHPLHWHAPLIERFAAGGPLVAYVDLPIQHVEDALLTAMNRRVTAERIDRLIGALRDRIDGLALRTTLIVGLPGETAAAFRRLLAFVRRVGFDHLGAFAYSAEPGTSAAAMAGQVPEDVKGRRLAELMACQQEIAFARARRRVDAAETAPLLVDAAVGEREYRGRFAHQAPDVDGVTYVSGRGLPVGRFINATVVGADELDLVAEPAPKPTRETCGSGRDG
jgi:ribosomal protein S12 methylthiotransferase